MLRVIRRGGSARGAGRGNSDIHNSTYSSYSGMHTGLGLRSAHAVAAYTGVGVGRGAGMGGSGMGMGMGGGMGADGGIGMGMGRGPTHTQVRNISFSTITNFTAQRRVNRAKKAMDESPGTPTLLTYMRCLGEVSPKEVTVYLERGWAQGVVPVDEAFLKEYFKAVGKLGRFDRISIASLLALLAKAQGAGVGAA
ncbi:hypothetical protein B484DRAFT_424905, partial [Ochromonadaceae sp. CCMP2298]